MKNLIILVLALLSGLVPVQCAGSYISLKINPISIFRENNIHIKADVINKGNEPAMSVWIEANVENHSSHSRIKETLEVDETFHAILELGRAPQMPGIYTVVLKAHYTDANGYPFAALESIPIITADMDFMEEPVIAHLSSAKLCGSGEIALLVRKNLSATGVPGEEKKRITKREKTIDIKATLILPAEIGCPAPTLNISIPSHGEKIARFNIRNISALPGSAYSIFAVIDYSLEGRHQSFIVPGSITIKPPWYLLSYVKPAALTAIILLLIAFITLQFAKKGEIERRIANSRYFTWLVLAVLFGFTLYHLHPSYLFLDTLTTGGDIPAHNYLASHLKEQLSGHGRIVSWCGGWWCGFPMFQFYFCLPYLLVSLLSFTIPFNIAFKIVSVLGILALPASAYLSARIMRMPKPVPILSSIAMIPLLFDNSNTMWGVNIYSTLAGMISNSISFPIMLIFIASACRDSDDGQFRLRTVLLLSALMASHFFTSIMAGLTIAIFLLLRPRSGFKAAFFVLIKECGLALLLMAWWLIPLIAKQEYAMDFGVNWDLVLIKNFPDFIFWVLPFAVIAIVTMFIYKIKFVAVTLWMLIISIFLFYFGYDYISKVFINVRFWPFITYALLALSAAGIGLLIKNFRMNALAVLAVLIAALTFGISMPNDVRNWTRWNYEGIEKKPNSQVFKELVLPLNHTPGRLANDLNAENKSLGSSRIFECVPHLIEKPILEGGIVNSALGSMFSYYIQGETSKNCAGFPPIVTPASFNFTNATKHLKLFNVKHFIAKWSETKKALSLSKDWKFLKESQGWELYELTTNNGRYVFIPKNQPIAVRVDNWKRAGLEWIYRIQSIDQPFILLRHGEKAGKRFGTVLTEKEFIKCLSETQNSKFKIQNSKFKIIDEKVTNNTIEFKTNAIGMPHIIKCSYYPNWKVKGAKKVYMVTPCFMLVYPEQEQVELYYGYTLSDNIGRCLTVLGLILFVVICRQKRMRRLSPHAEGVQHDSQGESLGLF